VRGGSLHGASSAELGRLGQGRFGVVAHEQGDGVQRRVDADGNAAGVSLLLDYGADPSRSPQISPLRLAVLTNDATVANLLITHGANVHEIGPNQGTLLHDAVLECDGNMMEVLLANGIDITARDNVGWTPLMTAESVTAPKNVRYLLDRGADASIADKSSGTALDIANALRDSADKRSIVRMLKHKMSSDRPLK